MQQSYTILSQHGSRGGRKTGSKINACEEMIEHAEADIYAQGHNHFIGFTSGIRQKAIALKGNVTIKNKDHYFVNTGSYLRSYVENQHSYSDDRGYKPQTTGHVKLILDPINNRIT